MASAPFRGASAKNVFRCAAVKGSRRLRLLPLNNPHLPPLWGVSYVGAERSAATTRLIYKPTGKALAAAVIGSEEPAAAAAGGRWHIMCYVPIELVAPDNTLTPVEITRASKYGLRSKLKHSTYTRLLQILTTRFKESLSTRFYFSKQRKIKTERKYAPALKQHPLK